MQIFFKFYWKLKGPSFYYQNFPDRKLPLPCCLLRVTGTLINPNTDICEVEKFDPTKNIFD